MKHRGILAQTLRERLALRLTGAPGVSTIALIVLLGFFHGCVEAADCDQSTPCSSQAQVCFKFRCLPRCAEDTPCTQGARCVSCEQEDACFGVAASACVQEALGGGQNDG